MFLNDFKSFINENTDLEYLKTLEAEYPNQPAFAQKADLAEINRLREKLGMPPFEPNSPKKATTISKITSKPKLQPTKSDHTEAKEIYDKYLKKIAELKPHREYAEKVERATAGSSMTPVEPLATMGTNGGPLLCDHCGKPMVLEGGKFHGKHADEAWRENPEPNWRSYILGGMVVANAPNDTLRVYHGYPNNQKQCYEIAKKEMDKAEAEFKDTMPKDLQAKILKFLEEELNQSFSERYRTLNDITQTLFSFDPGIGKNKP